MPPTAILGLQLDHAKSKHIKHLTFIDFLYGAPCLESPGRYTPYHKFAGF
jgi:hypothetical protein